MCSSDLGARRSRAAAGQGPTPSIPSSMATGVMFFRDDEEVVRWRNSGPSVTATTGGRATDDVHVHSALERVHPRAPPLGGSDDAADSGGIRRCRERPLGGDDGVLGTEAVRVSSIRCRRSSR